MDFFQQFSTVQALSSASRAQLNAICITKTVPKNEIIQQPGSQCRTIYFVKSGIARINYFNKGIDITEHFAFPGDLIVRAESLFTGQPTSKGIQALENTSLISIDAYKLEQLYDAHRDIERLFRHLFELEHVNVIHRLESLQFKTAAERYADLQSHSEIIKNISLKHIASYLGITQVSLSRIRAQKHE
ncbi:MAG: Crp/Fnr family transcriptional regulator [Bacteroidia bacterium]|nr:Crp/Fnr family transcriptional regulator [Bacteroidia bacterium]